MGILGTRGGEGRGVKGLDREGGGVRAREGNSRSWPGGAAEGVGPGEAPGKCSVTSKLPTSTPSFKALMAATAHKSPSCSAALISRRSCNVAYTLLMLPYDLQCHMTLHGGSCSCCMTQTVISQCQGIA